MGQILRTRSVARANRRSAVGVIHIYWVVSVLVLGLAFGLGSAARSAEPQPQKRESTFYPPAFRQKIAKAVASDPFGQARAKAIVNEAKFWADKSDEELWELMFGPALPRSWHVYSSGFCPACRKSVPMYTWRIDALREPWKVRCPHCHARFPTNDFAAYYRSGLNEQGIFDPARADRSLLFNSEHPDPNDPLHRFGVDDGTGYRQDGHCWRFVAAYLVYGQWKQLVLGGVRALVAAYLVTGDATYARKAAVILDRVAELHPQFDFRTQAFIYDVPSYANGYVTVWHDACEEVRLLALCYDAIFDAIKEDHQLLAFVAAQSVRRKLANPRDNFARIQAHFEHGLIRDPLAHVAKISSNFPRTHFTRSTLYAVLGTPEACQQAIAIMEEALTAATAVDGVTGEKGLSGYGAFATQGIARWLSLFDRWDPTLLERLCQKFPLRETFRFHLDTWALLQYYPRSGDAGVFARREERYQGLDLDQGQRSPIGGLDPAVPVASGWSLLWRLYEVTGDVDFVRLMYHENGRRVDGLPYDLAEEDPAAFRARVAAVLEKYGSDIRLPSVNKEKWAIALLRSGEGAHARVAWLDYDSGGGHGHADGFTLGLFARGLDLLPDFGYPLVQFGGWGSPRARWYMSTPAHNTVVVDGQNHRSASGKTIVWGQSAWCQVIRATCPQLIAGKIFDRTVLLVDKGPADFYVVDVFRVEGGQRHDKFIYAHFSRLGADGRLPPAQPVPQEATGYTHRNDVFLSRWRQLAPASVVRDLAPESIVFTWEIEDRYGYLPQDVKLSLRYFEASGDVEIFSAAAWIVPGFSSTEETYLPALVIRRTSVDEGSPLRSVFAGVYTVFEGGKSPIIRVRRVDSAQDEPSRSRLVAALREKGTTPIGSGDVVLEVSFADGSCDLVVARDCRGPLPAAPPSGQKPSGSQSAAGESEGAPDRAPAIEIFRFPAHGAEPPAYVCFPFRTEN